MGIIKLVWASQNVYGDHKMGVGIVKCVGRS